MNLSVWLGQPSKLSGQIIWLKINSLVTHPILMALHHKNINLKKQIKTSLGAASDQPNHLQYVNITLMNQNKNRSVPSFIISLFSINTLATNRLDWIPFAPVTCTCIRRSGDTKTQPQCCTPNNMFVIHLWQRPIRTYCLKQACSCLKHLSANATELESQKYIVRAKKHEAGPSKVPGTLYYQTNDRNMPQSLHHTVCTG
eukprot:scaffold284602_cov17-Tisochrysis_lutea.AAC.1